MAIKSKINATPPSDLEYPLLRQLKINPKLVVLFTSLNEGVALAGVPSERVGVPEKWAVNSHPDWVPTSLTLTSED